MIYREFQDLKLSALGFGAMRLPVAAGDDSRIDETAALHMVDTAMKEIYLAGGCFWGMQKFFDQFDGITETEVGYANGPEQRPSYQDVCNNSGHAETLRIQYDERCLPLTKLLEYYFTVIDPVSVNRQGNDIGIQYRTGIYYTEDGQLPEIMSVFREEEKKTGTKLAVSVEKLTNFYSAEEYHQKYLDKNPGGYCHIPEEYFHM